MAEIEDLGTVIDESTVLAATVDEGQRRFRLHFGIRAHPSPGTNAMPEVVIEFVGLSRVACRVQQGESYKDPTPEQSWRVGWREVGPPTPVADVDALNDWLDRFRDDLYGQPNPMFDRKDPDWLGSPSLDFARTGGSAHTVDLELDTTPAVKNHRMKLRAWFERIEASDVRGQPVEVEAVVDAVRARWRDFKAGRTGGEYGYVRARE